MPERNAQHWIDHLALMPHPEGGFYREVFRSAQQVKRSDAGHEKSACTSIYYLLEGTDYSGFHRIVSDEIWYFHAGVPLILHCIDAAGVLTSPELSEEPGGRLCIAIPGGVWFAAELPSKSGFTLSSCAVAPGFEFSEFEMAKREELIVAYPEHASLLHRLCRE